MLGEDFLDVFETSPIPVSIEMTLNAEYVSADSMQVAASALMAPDSARLVRMARALA